MKTNLQLQASKAHYTNPSLYFIAIFFFSVFNSYAQCTKTWYRDADNDGFGDPADTQVSCTLLLAGYVLNGLDCNDGYANSSIRKEINNLSSSRSVATEIDLDADGKAVVLYANTNDPFPATWTVKKFDGSNWIALGLDPIPSPSNAEVNEACMVLDASGVPYIFFGDGNSGDYRSTVLTYNSNTTAWEIVGVDRFSSQIQVGAKKDIKFDKNGVLHIAFTGAGGGVNVMKYDGGTWQIIGASDFGFAASTPGVTLSFDNNNIPYVAFAEDVDLKATVMKFDGTNWIDVGLRAFSDGDIDLPTIDFNSFNVPYVAYSDYSSNEVVVQQFISGVWVKVGNTSVDNTSASSVSFAIDLTDVPVIAYSANTTNNPISVKKLDAGNNWIITDTNIDRGQNVSLSIGPDNNPYVSFSDFANGDFAVAQSVAPNPVPPSTPTVSATPASTICSGGSTTLEVTGNLNDATEWVWYAGGCGNGTSIGNGTSLLVSPTTTTTYFVRGEGNCSTSTGICASITITVDTPPTINTQPTTTQSLCVGSALNLSVSATGTALSYQWKKNGTDILLATSSTYSIASVSVADAATYTVVVTSGVCSVVSNNAVVTIDTAPTITTQPTISQPICVGSNVTLGVTATGTNLTYQWQEDNGSGFVNLTNGGVYGGVTTATLTLTNVPAAMTSNRYRVIVRNNGCSPATSNGLATLTVNTAPAISAAPADVTICSGSNTTFSATATGTNLTYQWQEDNGSGFANLSNGGVYGGITTATLALTNVPVSMDGRTYRVIVSNNGCISATSNGLAMLTVNTAPAISAAPTDVTICSGSNTIFSATATGTNLTYQWQEDNGSGFVNLSNGGVYGGVTTATLSLTNVPVSMDGRRYRVVVSNSGCISATSNGLATLTVNTAPAISTAPTDVTICSGSNTTFSVTATGTNLTYQWQEDSGSGFVNLSNSGVYGGVTTATLALSNVPVAMNGRTYRVIVSNNGCSPATSNGLATLTVNTAPAISAAPADATICSGSNTSFIATATGTNLNYQWQEDNGSGFVNLSNGGVYGGVTTATLALTNVPAAMSANRYRVVVSNSGCTSATSNGLATLTVNTVPAISAAPTDVTICSGSNTTFSATATGTNLTYQWQEDSGSGFVNLSNGGVYSGVTTATLALTNVPVSMTSNRYRVVVSNSGCTSATSNSLATLTVNTAPAISAAPTDVTICSGSNTSFSATATGTNLTYQWQEDSGSGFANLSNGGVYGGVTTATLALTNVPVSMDGRTYRVIVSNNGCISATSNGLAILTVNTASAISAAPVDVTICSGNNATFSATATGTNLTYQWQENSGSGFVDLSNGGVYGGVTTSILTLTNVPVSMTSNRYRVVVSNSGCISATSNGLATLTVNTAPAISAAPADVTICSGSNTSFSATATGTNLTYQWQEDNGSGFVNLSNGGVYGGVTTSTLTLTNVPAAMSANRYRVVVSNTGCTSATSNGLATLTVNTSPAISASPADATICSGSNTSFSATATGTNLTYQWQENSGSGFVNLSNGGVYGGVTTATLALTNVPVVMDGRSYRVIVSNSGCTSATSNGLATLTVNTIPTISAAPTNTTICSSSNTTFSATATGTNLNYQWQEDNGSGFVNLSNGGVYGGVTTATLALTNVPVAMDGRTYRVVVSNTGCTSATSNGLATLTVNTTPAISAAPTNATICSGGNTTFNATATGTNLTYQWQEDNGSGFVNLTSGGVYGGVTTATLALSNVPVTMNGRTYRVLISNTGCTSATSNGLATLTVNTAPVISVAPADVMICSGSNTTFSATAIGTNLTYQWQVNSGNGFANLSNGGVYGGVTTSTLSLTNVPATMTSNRYRVIVSNIGCSSATSNGLATLTVNTPPTINAGGNPANAAICAGSNATFSVTATGNNLTYQWQVNNGSGYINLTNINGYNGVNSATLQIISVPASMNGYQFRVLVSTPSCSAVITSNSASLNLNTPQLITTQPVDQGSCAEESVSFEVNAITGNYTYQWQVDEGSGFNDLTNNNGYSGATSSELLINPLRSDMNGYRYRVMVGGSCGVETSMSATLAVYDLPEVSAGEDVTIPNGSTTTLQGMASGAAPLQYLWMPMEDVSQASSLQPAVSPFTDTEYTLTVTSAQGCVASDAVMVFVTGERELIIPNAFSPNNDAINDTWEIQNLNPTTSISVNVFNRYGQTVFATNNYPISWDGRYNGNLLPWGTYYYVIELSNPSKTISGWVVILN